MKNVHKLVSLGLSIPVSSHATGNRWGRLHFFDVGLDSHGLIVMRQIWRHLQRPVALICDRGVVCLISLADALPFEQVLSVVWARHLMMLAKYLLALLRVAVMWLSDQHGHILMVLHLWRWVEVERLGWAHVHWDIACIFVCEARTGVHRNHASLVDLNWRLSCARWRDADCHQVYIFLELIVFIRPEWKDISHNPSLLLHAFSEKAVDIVAWIWIDDQTFGHILVPW